MEIPENLREIVDRLGVALVKALANDESSRALVQEIQSYGFDMALMLEATVALHKREADHEGFDGPAGQIFELGWAMLKNYRLFTIRGQGAEGELFKSEFLFASGTVYNFNLYPDDAKDYADLDRIVGEVSVGLR